MTDVPRVFTIKSVSTNTLVYEHDIAWSQKLIRKYGFEASGHEFHAKDCP